MKQLVCEMCGGNDLLKDGEYFICQHCGTKYTVEAARKMMIEGTVDVKGTVQIDNSSTVNKYLQNARRAKEKEDWDEVEKYYNLVEQNDPDNIEAVFYSAYAKAKSSLIVNEIYKRKEVFKVFGKSISIIDDKFLESQEESQVALLSNMAMDILRLMGSSFVYTEWKNGNGLVRTDAQKTYALLNNVAIEFASTLENISKNYNNLAVHLIVVSFAEGYQNSKDEILTIGGIRYTNTLMSDALFRAAEIDHSYKKRAIEFKITVLKISKNSRNREAKNTFVDVLFKLFGFIFVCTFFGAGAAGMNSLLSIPWWLGILIGILFYVLSGKVSKIKFLLFPSDKKKLKEANANTDKEIASLEAELAKL